MYFIKRELTRKLYISNRLQQKEKCIHIFRETVCTMHISTLLKWKYEYEAFYLIWLHILPKYHHYLQEREVFLDFYSVCSFLLLLFFIAFFNGYAIRIQCNKVHCSSKCRNLFVCQKKKKNKKKSQQHWITMIKYVVYPKWKK